MIIVAPLVIAVLLAIAGLHLAWGLGVLWPVTNETQLVATVIGIKGVTRMPGLVPCLMVVAGLAWWQVKAPSWLPQLALLAAAAVFLVRGVAVWTPFWRALTPQQPFARLDVTLYGPLCLALGAGLVFIALRARA